MVSRKTRATIFTKIRIRRLLIYRVVRARKSPVSVANGVLPNTERRLAARTASTYFSSRHRPRRERPRGETPAYHRRLTTGLYLRKKHVRITIRFGRYLTILSLGVRKTGLFRPSDGRKSLSADSAGVEIDLSARA